MSSMSSPSSTVSGMSGMNMGGDCKSSMFWNWYTVDACFISTTWHVTSSGMFAGSCIGVICLVILLEFFRRVQREFDQLSKQSHCGPDVSKIEKQQIIPNAHHAIIRDSKPTAEVSPSHEDDSTNDKDHYDTIPPSTPLMPPSIYPNHRDLLARHPVRQYRGNSIAQHLIRSSIYTCQFMLAYIVMLLAMYYNGYILISIFIGAFLGSFIWGWDLGAAEAM
ncbi:copper transporter complex subunit Ctr4 [Lecanora helva]